jgi:glycosyltransferase involved in cell wall biosynthesis
MIVCYLGPYDPKNGRNRVILKGLMENGVKLIECNAYSSNRIIDYIRLLRKHVGLSYDVVMLGARGEYYGQPLVPFVKSMTKKPLVFDAMLTLHETNVIDRKLVNKGSVKAKLWYFLDYKALNNASLVLSDTYTHAKYYSHFYNVEFNKFGRVLVGSDDEIFYPRVEEKESDYFLVMFWGGFIPLQGVKYIIRAAKLLESYKNVKFELRGFGQTYDEALDLSRSLEVKNVTFVSNWVSYDKLPNYIAKADLCLGIFGETEKAQRVIPTKAADALAMRKPLITGDSPAAREILKDRENCMLVPMANPKALAEAILTLKEDDELREKIAENGYRLFKEKLSPKAIGKDLKLILTEIVEKSR